MPLACGCMQFTSQTLRQENDLKDTLAGVEDAGGICHLGSRAVENS